MPHETELTESQYRHVDEHRHHVATNDGALPTFLDMETESQARHVDEYRHAIRHAEEEESPS